MERGARRSAARVTPGRIVIEQLGARLPCARYRDACTRQRRYAHGRTCACKSLESLKEAESRPWLQLDLTVFFGASSGHSGGADCSTVSATWG